MPSVSGKILTSKCVIATLYSSPSFLVRGKAVVLDFEGRGEGAGTQTELQSSKRGGIQGRTKAVYR